MSETNTSQPAAQSTREQSISAETIYQQIQIQARHAKSKTAIENIKAACDYLDSQQIPISAAEVGRQTEKYRGGPTAPSIRNNKKFIEYIGARRRAQNLSRFKEGQGTPVRTGNAEADAYIFALEVELKTVQRELSLLRSSISKQGDYDLSMSLEERKLVLAATPAGKVPTNPSNVAQKEIGHILMKLLDPKHLEPFGLILDQGRIKSPERNMRVFLEKAEVACLQNELQRIKNEITILDN